MDEQEHPAGPETPASGETTPVTGPAPAAGPAPASGQVPGTGSAPVTGLVAAGLPAGSGQDRRGDGAKDVITSRGAGWAVAAAMAGAVVGLSVAMATSSSPTIVVQDAAAGLRGTPAGAVPAAVPGGALRVVAPGRVQAQAPVRLRIQAPARLRIQVPAAGSFQAPARLRIQVPAAGALQVPARLGLAPALAPAGTLIPLPAASQLLQGVQSIGDVMAPRPVRVRIRPGQVRMRLRVPANGRLQVLPGRAVAGPLRVVVPASVPARVLVPASLPGQARLRIQVPTRARIQVPARARITRPCRPRLPGKPVEPPAQVTA